jgi:hypothetical protein
MTLPPVARRVLAITELLLLHSRRLIFHLMSAAGMLTQRGQGARPAPLASRFHSILTNYPLNSHGMMEATYLWPAWLSGSYHPRSAGAYMFGQMLQAMSRRPNGFSRPGRLCHSALHLAVIGCHLLGVCTVIFLPLLSFSATMTVSSVARLRPHQGEHGRPRLRQPRRHGEHRARSHFRFVPPLILFIPASLRYLVPLFLKRQCDRTLGGHTDRRGRHPGLPARPVHIRDANSGGQGGRPAPLASRFHGSPTHFSLHLYGIHLKFPTAVARSDIVTLADNDSNASKFAV